jgi:hypothetical protein
MSKPTPEQIAKLPKWARDEIEHLERRIGVLTDALDAETTKPIKDWNSLPDGFYVENFEDGYRPLAKYRHPVIVAQGVKYSIFMRDHHEGFEVNSCQSEGLVVLPWATNCIYIRKAGR